jgi:hypothetical protein
VPIPRRLHGQAATTAQNSALPEPAPPPNHVDATSRAECALVVLNILLSDVRYGLGAYLGVYLLTEHHWDEASICLLLISGLVGLLSQTPIGLMVDAVRAKRLLLASVVLVVTVTCLSIQLAPRFWPMPAAGVVGALAGTTIPDARLDFPRHRRAHPLCAPGRPQ